MTPEQKAAFNNSLSSAFTEEEATLVLDWYGVPQFDTGASVGVMAAVVKLGGTVGRNKSMGYYPVNYKGIHDTRCRPNGVFPMSNEQGKEMFDRWSKDPNIRRFSE